MLVDDFEHRTLFDSEGPRPISLRELQEAIEAAAPPLTPEPMTPPRPASTPLCTSTPLPADHAPADPAPADPAPADPAPADLASSDPTPDSAVSDTPVGLALPTPVKKERKRRLSINNIGDIIEGSLKLKINEGKCILDHPSLQ